MGKFVALQRSLFSRGHKRLLKVCPELGNNYSPIRDEKRVWSLQMGFKKSQNFKLHKVKKKPKRKKQMWSERQLTEGS